VLAYPKGVNKKAFYYSIVERFSFTDRALIHLKKISEKPHYVGTSEHTNVRNYLVDELRKMGLKVEIQEQEVMNPKWNAACKIFNVLTRIEGSNSQERHCCF
jgi:heme oxygenase